MSHDLDSFGGLYSDLNFDENLDFAFLASELDISFAPDPIPRVNPNALHYGVDPFANTPRVSPLTVTASHIPPTLAPEDTLAANSLLPYLYGNGKDGDTDTSATPVSLSTTAAVVVELEAASKRRDRISSSIDPFVKPPASVPAVVVIDSVTAKNPNVTSVASKVAAAQFALDPTSAGLKPLVAETIPVVSDKPSRRKVAVRRTQNNSPELNNDECSSMNQSPPTPIKSKSERVRSAPSIPSVDPFGIHPAKAEFPATPSVPRLAPVAPAIPPAQPQPAVPLVRPLPLQQPPLLPGGLDLSLMRTLLTSNPEMLSSLTTLMSLPRMMAGMNQLIMASNTVTSKLVAPIVTPTAPLPPRPKAAPAPANDGLTDEERERKARNNAASARFRQRKKMELQTAEDRAQLATNQCALIEQQILLLETEKQSLMEELTRLHGHPPKLAEVSM